MATYKKGEPPNRTKTTKPKASQKKPQVQASGTSWHISRASAWADQRLKPEQKVKSSEKYPGFGKPRTTKPRPKKTRESQGTLTIGGGTKTSSSKPSSWAKTYTKPSSARAQSAAARARRKKK